MRDVKSARHYTVKNAEKRWKFCVIFVVFDFPGALSSCSKFPKITATGTGEIETRFAPLPDCRRACVFAGEAAHEAAAGDGIRQGFRRRFWETESPDDCRFETWQTPGQLTASRFEGRANMRPGGLENCAPPGVHGLELTNQECVIVRR
jgi:hypothetical protein